MPPIQTADQAAVRADAFIGRYRPFKKLLSLHRENDSWRLVYDVGILAIEKVEITLDAATGDVISYGPVQQ